jgi:DHA1 family multidrug resistance protein-like MFS transporter
MKQSSQYQAGDARPCSSASLLSAGEWRGSQIVLAVSVLTAFVGYGMSMPFLPLYVQTLGVTRAEQVALWSGILFGIGPLMGSFLTPIWGDLSDRYGRKLMLQRSLVGFTIFMSLMGLVANVWQLLVLRIFTGLFSGFLAMVMTLVTDLSPVERVGESIGFVHSGRIVGLAMGSAIGGLLASRLSFRPAFVIGGMIQFFAMLLITMGCKEPTMRQSKAVRASIPQSLRHFRSLPSLQPLLVVLFLIGVVESSISPILPLYVADLAPQAATSAALTGAILALGSVATVVSMTVGGQLSRQRSPRLLLLLALGLGVLPMIFIATVSTWWQLGVLFVLLRLLSGGALSLAYTLGGLTMPQERRGALFGVLAIGPLLSGALGPVGSGVLGALDLRAVFVVDSVLCLMAFIVVMRYVVNHEEECEPTKRI